MSSLLKTPSESLISQVFLFESSELLEFEESEFCGELPVPFASAPKVLKLINIEKKSKYFMMTP